MKGVAYDLIGSFEVHSENQRRRIRWKFIKIKQGKSINITLVITSYQFAGNMNQERCEKDFLLSRFS
ncbi:CLUMA_CG001197, isoform A [Clunio marinus]|uniref:CLUMA_CG001197, isoform A n=1 Tax=Clunio marinus TaxID=568069 RepID=A0A1J1HHN2_9DIPT|nr:CLUMA_CG001197, isoform A [Clunio marinus]